MSWNLQFPDVPEPNAQYLLCEIYICMYVGISWPSAANHSRNQVSTATRPWCQQHHDNRWEKEGEQMGKDGETNKEMRKVSKRYM